MKKPKVLTAEEKEKAFADDPRLDPSFANGYGSEVDTLLDAQLDADLKWVVEWLDSVLIYHNGVPHLPLSHLQELKKLAEEK